MAIVKTGGGVTDIRGGVGGVYFHRDKSGLHVARQPRVIRRRTSAQSLQRNAFVAARRYSTDYRTVSYLMYRYMNGLSLLYPPEWISPVSFSDPIVAWYDEPFAYDDDLNTFAHNPAADAAFPLNLFPDKPYLSYMIRVNAAGRVGPNTEDAQSVLVDVRDVVTGWQNIHNGVLPERMWTELSFIETTIDAIRVTSADATREFLLYEVDFQNILNPADGTPYYPVPIDYQIPHLQGP